MNHDVHEICQRVYSNLRKRSGRRIYKKPIHADRSIRENCQDHEVEALREDVQAATQVRVR